PVAHAQGTAPVPGDRAGAERARAAGLLQFVEGVRGRAEAGRLVPVPGARAPGVRGRGGAPPIRAGVDGADGTAPRRTGRHVPRVPGAAGNGEIDVREVVRGAVRLALPAPRFRTPAAGKLQRAPPE